MDDQTREILGMFYAEAEEGLQAAEAQLAALIAGSADAEAINVVFRAVHSIKGSAGAFGCDALASFAHRFESLLDDVRAGRVPSTADLWRLCARACDMLSDHLAAARSVAPPPSDNALLDELLAACAQPECGSSDVFAPAFVDLNSIFAASPAARMIRFRPSATALENGGEPMLAVREATSAGLVLRSIEADALRSLADIDLDRPVLTFVFEAPAGISDEALRAPFMFMPDDCIVEDAAGSAAPSPTAVAPASPEKPPAVASPTSAPPLPPATPTAEPVKAGLAPQMIRVELDKLDRIVALVGEIVINNAVLESWVSGNVTDRPPAMVDRERLTRELQDAVMAIRAQPVRTAFDRIPRIIRELESETGRQVRLIREGEATEVDKTVIERIGEPLVHLIRNAVDHGIEPPEERLAAGKDAVGRITLAAESKGSSIILRITDDGRGIRRDKVLAKAIERGLVSEADASVLSPSQVDDLIFTPGFSTAPAVTKISGRGVGMDVVRKNITALGGRVTITSEPGAGSSVTMVLPLTLAILDGMIVAAGGEKFILPLSVVVECLSLDRHRIDRLSNQSGVMAVRGTYLPVLDLAEALGGAHPAPRLAIVVETERFGRVALLVEHVLDQRQIVIKSIESNYRTVPDIAGATILGDGQVALILDIESIAARLGRSGDRRAAA